MDLNLAARVALVTGGASGLGFGIAAALHAEGCDVHVADLDYAAAERAVGTMGARSHALRMDVTDAADVMQKIGAVGSIDILVNSAGILQTASVFESSPGDWQKICAVNLSGVFHCVKAAIPAMCERRHGRIINIASVSAQRGGGAFGNVLYGTTKAGVLAMTRGLARELGPHGITVNSISPGVVETAMTQSRLQPELRARMLERFPLQRFPAVSEVVSLALYLASDLGAAITGQDLVVDCGFLTR